MFQNNKGYPFPCCGFLTLSERAPGTFEICPVCNWEDDDAQFQNPNLKEGANQTSLNEARQNFKKFAASSLNYINEVRPPHKEEIP